VQKAPTFTFLYYTNFPLN